MLTHENLVKKMLKEPGVKAEYDALAEEFSMLDELLRARQRSAPPLAAGAPFRYTIRVASHTGLRGG